MESDRSAFLAEIEEHLDALEQALLNLDQADPSDAALSIHAMFRHAHSLKSSLGMADLSVSSGILHTMETHLDAHRTSGGRLEAADVDLFLRAVDQVRTNLVQDQETPFAFDDILKVEPGEAAEGRPGGEWLVQKSVGTSLSEKRLYSLPIFKTIDSVGTLLEIKPPYANWPESDDQITLTIRFRSELPLEALQQKIFDPILPAPAGGPSTVEEYNLKTLIVEDDFATRHLEASVLSRFGLCDVAVDGREALDAFRSALEEKSPYDLVILDILLPELSGHEVLDGMRKLEDDRRIGGLDRAKIVVVSTVSEHQSIRQSFSGQADAYLIKPVTRKKIQQELSRLHILKVNGATH